MKIIIANIEINFNNAHSMRIKYYYNTKFKLAMLGRMSKRNNQILMQHNIRAYLLFQRMALELKSGWDKTALDVITVEVTKAVMYELFDKNHIKGLLDELVKLGYIARASESQRNNHYYINPNVIHFMTGPQCEEFVKKHIELFAHWEDAEYDMDYESNYGVPQMTPLPQPIVPKPVVMTNYQPGQTPLPDSQ